MDSASTVGTISASVAPSSSSPTQAPAAPSTSKSIHFLVYADRPPYTHTQKLMVDSIAKDPNVRQIASYNFEGMQAAFRSFETTVDGVPFVTMEGKNVSGGMYLDTVLNATQQGFCKHKASEDPVRWAWKPLLMYSQMQQSNKGDWIVYHDASKYIRSGFNESLSLITDRLDTIAPDGVAGACLVFNTRTLYKRFAFCACIKTTLPRVAELAKTCPPEHVDEGCINRLRRAPMHQASWVVLRNTPKGRAFLRRWMEITFNLALLARLPFSDQDAMGLTAFEHDFPCAFMPTVNGHPNYENGDQVKHLQPFMDRIHSTTPWVAVKPSDPTNPIDAIIQQKRQKRQKKKLKRQSGLQSI